MREPSRQVNVGVNWTRVMCDVERVRNLANISLHAALVLHHRCSTDDLQVRDFRQNTGISELLVDSFLRQVRQRLFHSPVPYVPYQICRLGRREVPLPQSVL
jgi:squalene cyclase